MAYFFRQINTTATSKKSEKYDIIYNLDEFHTIRRMDNKIYGFRGSEGSKILAVCKSSAGAEYIMQCIMRKSEVDLYELSHRERVM